MSVDSDEKSKPEGVKVVSNFNVLMHLAHELGQARLHGTPEEVAAAQAAHDDYRDACLRSDEMSLGMTVGELSPGN